jgi:hypothetical protein
MAQLTFAEFLADHGDTIGRVLGMLAGVPGGSVVGGWAGQAYLDYVMKHFNFSSPVEMVEDPAMQELMSAVDPDYDARQNSSSGSTGGAGGGSGGYGSGSGPTAWGYSPRSSFFRRHWPNGREKRETDEPDRDG